MTTGITFLTEKQIWGDDQGNGQLQVMKSYGTKTGMSDLAIALGGYMGSDKTSDNQRSGYVWSASSDGDGYVRFVHDGGDRDFCSPRKRLVGARPALPSSVASSIKPSEARLTKKIGHVQVVEYGEYPQTIAPENVNKELEQAFSKGQLGTTGKKYTFYGEKSDAYDKPFKAKEYAEYQYNGKRYIRVEAQPYDRNSVLSNGRLAKNGEKCWIEVQPIEWMVEPDKITINGRETDNPNAGLWLARQALFSGVQFDSKNRYDGNFENTDIYRFINGPFLKEMQPSYTVDAPDALGPSTAALAARRGTQRPRALEVSNQWFERDGNNIEPTEELVAALSNHVLWPTNECTVEELRKKGHFQLLPRTPYSTERELKSDVLQAEMDLAELLAKKFAGQEVYDSQIQTAEGLRPVTIDENIASRQKDLIALYQEIGIANDPVYAKVHVETLSKHIVAMLKQITGMEPVSRGQAK